LLSESIKNAAEVQTRADNVTALRYLRKGLKFAGCLLAHHHPLIARALRFQRQRAGNQPQVHQGAWHRVSGFDAVASERGYRMKRRELITHIGGACE
jgi:hypothetical protein